MTSVSTFSKSHQDTFETAYSQTDSFSLLAQSVAEAVLQDSISKTEERKGSDSSRFSLHPPYPPYESYLEDFVPRSVDGILHPQDYFNLECLKEERGRGNRSILHIAVERGDIFVVDVIMHMHPHLVHHPAVNWWTPLHVAISLGHDEIAMLLLASSSKEAVNGSICTGHTPLHLAVLTQRPALICPLLDQGADPRLRDQFHRDALFYAWDAFFFQHSTASTFIYNTITNAL